jgi:hypothetical protein
MSAPSALRKVRDARALPVVSALEAAGLLDPHRHDDALAVVDQTLSGQRHVGDSTPLRQRLAELAGYVGGALVVAAAVVFAADEWPNLAVGEQVAVLAVSAMFLAGAGVLILATGGGLAELRSSEQEVRRRLTGVLFAGAAGLAALAVLVWVDDAMAGGGVGPAAWSSGVLLVLAAAGYVLAPTMVGQALVAYATVQSLALWLDASNLFADEFGGPDPAALGILLLVVGAVWLVLVEREVWRELATGRVLGAGIVLLGAQMPVGSDHAWVGYLATAVVAGAGFALYVVRPAWPYLALGVAGVTLVVPEALLDWTEGSLGSSGVLLVAGVTLLGASLLGLRLRREVTEQADEDDEAGREDAATGPLA